MKLFPVAAVYLGIVETESELLRLSQNLIWGFNFGKLLLNSSVGAFAITSPGAHFAVGSLFNW